MKNPFYLHEVPVDAPFCDRERELKDLSSYARAKANVVLFSPRRYGKTSLVKRIQNRLTAGGAVTIYADFFGLASVEDAAARLAKAAFGFSHGRRNLWKATLKALASFRPVLKPDAEGGVTLTVEPATGLKGLSLLEETLSNLGRLARDTEKLIHVTFDEFQEIVVLKEATQVEAIARSHLQRGGLGCFFVGSRRRLLLGMFNDRQRPFFQSAINYALNPLPADDLVNFLIYQFDAGGAACSKTVTERMAAILSCHPYYTQKLAFLMFEPGLTVTEDALEAGIAKLLSSESPVFEAIILGLAAGQRMLLRALAQQPTAQILAGTYLQRYNLGSASSIQHASRVLEEQDLIEKDPGSGLWHIVDPVFALWLRSQTEQVIKP